MFPASIVAFYDFPLYRGDGVELPTHVFNVCVSQGDFALAWFAAGGAAAICF
jgi:hypothetical protein